MSRASEYLDAKAAAVAALAGKRGVVAARVHLTTLYAEHGRMAHQAIPYRIGRSPYAADCTRRQIQEWATWEPRRGEHGELALPPAIPVRLRSHPALRTAGELRTNLDTAQNMLPNPFQEWDNKGRGEGVSLDLYGYADAGRVSVWQVREVSRSYRNGYLSVRKCYRLIVIGDDGPEIRAIPPHKIKRAAAADPAPDSPIRALNGELRLPAGGVEWTAFKLVARTPDGRLLSLFDGETEYVIGKRLAQSARAGHEGGFYVSRTPEAAREHGADAQRCSITGGLPTVLLECRVIGRGIQYANAKVAVGVLTPTAILE